MSLINQTVRAIYQGNEIQTVFPIPFDVIKNDSQETKVWRRDETNPLVITETLLTEGVHYNLTGAAPPAIPFDTDVTFLVAPLAAHKILVIRDIPNTQDTEYQETGPFPAEVHEKALDKIMAEAQELGDLVRRALKIRITDPHSGDLPQPQNNTVIGWDDTSPTQLLRLFTPNELMTLASGALLIVNNLSDLASVPTALLNLGIDPFKTTKTATLNNNVAVNTNITAMTVLGASHRAAVWFYSIQRSTDTKESVGMGVLVAFRRPTGNWVLDVGPFWHFNSDVVFDPAGITFASTQVGADLQVQYQSHNLTGANYVGNIKFSEKLFAI